MDGKGIAGLLLGTAIVIYGGGQFAGGLITRSLKPDGDVSRPQDVGRNAGAAISGGLHEFIMGTFPAFRNGKDASSLDSGTGGKLRFEVPLPTLPSSVNSIGQGSVQPVRSFESSVNPVSASLRSAQINGGGVVSQDRNGDGIVTLDEL
ncbi:MAG: hypothetical protein KME06_09640 [Kastovskya adunca ATA6-11-RM4]|jgi:hypothetical protein|nr:hypothetical protein [Kastovskya adunca ATA6-11-RM4]